jgi:hypothetical protein
LYELFEILVNNEGGKEKEDMKEGVRKRRWRRREKRVMMIMNY